MKLLFTTLILSAFAAFGIKAWTQNKEGGKTAELVPASTALIIEVQPDLEKLNASVNDLYGYALKNNIDTTVFFIIDMSMPSGTKRFFVYDHSKNKLIASGLVAHGQGSRNTEAVQFSNTPGSLCSSAGKYKIGSGYIGRFGPAFKLHGLEATNDNAYGRYVVLHAHPCVPNKEVYPERICLSQGCPTVAPDFLQELSVIIRKHSKPILMEILE